MELLLAAINFFILVIIIGLIIYLFITLVKLSIKLNDLKYKITKPTIPFQNNNTFQYTENTPGKNLL